MVIPNLSWHKKWGLRFAGVAGTQVLAQLINGVVAFLLVRYLGKPEYAWFTIAGTFGTILSSLNEGGIATAVLSRGGQVWNERPKLSALVVAALDQLKRNAAFAALVVAPLLIWLLHTREAPWSVILVVALLVVCPQWIATRTAILNCVNRLHTRVKQLQMGEMAAALSRACVSLAPLAFGVLNLEIALLAVVIAMLVHAKITTNQVAPLLQTQVDFTEVESHKRAIRATMKKMYPNNVFGCIQAQLATGLLSVFGNTSQVADLGALNRLGFFSNLINAPLAQLVSPGLARASDRGRVIRLFLVSASGLGSLVAAFVFVAATRADWVLSLLGPKYAHLQAELLLVVGGLGLAFLNQMVWTLNFARGWIDWVWANIPLTILTQVVAVSFLDVSTVAGAALLSAITVIPTMLLGFVVAVRGISTFPKVTT